MTHLTSTVSEQVLGFGTRSNELFVLFRNEATEYTLSSEHDKFAELVAKLAKSWQQRQPVKVYIRGMRIIAVENL